MKQEIPVGCLPFVLLMALVFFGIAEQKLNRVELMESKGILTDVLITDKWDVCEQKTCTHYFSYNYRIEDHTYIIRAEEIRNYSLYKDYEIGDTAAMRYSPTNIHNTLLVGNNYGHPWMFVIAYMFLGGFGAGIVTLESPYYWHFSVKGKLFLTTKSAILWSIGLAICLGLLSLSEPWRLGLFLILLSATALYLFIQIQSVHSLKNTIVYTQNRSPRAIRAAKKNRNVTSQDMTKQLRELGFEPMGETRIEKLDKQNQYDTQWIYRNESGFITAEFTRQSIDRINFVSRFGKQTIVETSYPDGDWFDEPHYRCRFSNLNMKDAFRSHLEAMNDFQAQIWQPTAIQDMWDIVQWDDIWRDRYAPFKFQREIKRQQRRLVYAVGMLAYWVACLYIVAAGSPSIAHWTLVAGFVGMFIGDVASANVWFPRRKKELDEPKIKNEDVMLS
jgi:membrane protein implicated in regulation of membrane protease activity